MTVIARHDNGQPALTLNGWELADHNETTRLTTADLPMGWDTPGELAGCAAGRAYLLDRWGIAEPSDYPEVQKRYETCQPPHPECYVLTYFDGSAYVRSNADDEVWVELADYLERYALAIEGDTIVAQS